MAKSTKAAIEVALAGKFVKPHSKKRGKSSSSANRLTSIVCSKIVFQEPM
jgi:hypothetical protein